MKSPDPQAEREVKKAKRILWLCVLILVALNLALVLRVFYSN